MSESLGSNCYLIADEKNALIDSGIDSTQVIERLDKLESGLDFLILTHCHFDHIAGASDIIDRFHPKIATHQIDADFIESGDDSMILNELFGRRFRDMDIDIKLEDGNVINLGKAELKVIHTPGHTRGSICLYDSRSRSLFSGDTVFSDGIGRIDFPGGNWNALRMSLKRLIELHRNSGIKTLYPGHGPIGDGKDIERVYEVYFER